MTNGEYLAFEFCLMGRLKIINQRLENTTNMFTVIDLEARKNTLEEILDLFEKEFNEPIK